jgi:hypothetical protein
VEFARALVTRPRVRLDSIARRTFKRAECQQRQVVCEFFVLAHESQFSSLSPN